MLPGGGRVVKTISLAAHVSPEPTLAQDLMIVIRTVLAAAIGERFELPPEIRISY